MGCHLIIKNIGLSIVILCCWIIPCMGQASHSIIVYKQPVNFFSKQTTGLPANITVKQKESINLSQYNTASLFAFMSKETVELWTIESDLNIEDVATAIETLSFVTVAEPNYELELYTDIRFDPLAVEQTYLFQQDLYQLWSLPLTQPITVAVIDTGIDIDHPDLIDTIYINEHEKVNGLDDDHNGYPDDVSGYSWIDLSHRRDGYLPHDDHGHGTHLAGIIGAKHNNKGISGIHPNAQILPLKIFNAQGKGTQLDAALAIRYAVDKKVDIINCSWGYYRKTKTLEDAINYALENGITVIAAVGNAGAFLSIYPAAFSGVIGVGSIDYQTKKLSNYSNWGSMLDIVVDGSNMYSTTLNSGYQKMTGTSQSTAVVSGIIGLLKSYKPQFTSSDYLTTLKQTADEYTNRKWPLPNSTALLAEFGVLASITLDDQAYITELSSSSTTLSNVMNAPNPITSDTTTFYFQSTQADVTAGITLYSLEGKKLKEVSITASLGQNSVQMDVSDLLNGVYIYVLKIEDTGDIVAEKCHILR